MATLRIGGPVVIAGLLLASLLFGIHLSASMEPQPPVGQRANAEYFPESLYAKYPEDIRTMVRMFDVELDRCAWGHSDDPGALNACNRAAFAHHVVWKRGWCFRLTQNYSPGVWTKCAADERIRPGYEGRPMFTDAEIAKMVADRKADGSHARFVAPIALSQIRSASRPGTVPASPARAMEILKAQQFSRPLDRNATLRRMGRVHDARHSFDFYLLEQDGEDGHLGEAIVVLLDSEKYVGHYPLDAAKKCTMREYSIACDSDHTGRVVLNYRYGRLPAQMFLDASSDLSR